MANIFEENAYTKEIETRIKEINKENKTIELEDTIFYGKSGGQPGDVGEIIADGQKIEVNDTIKIEGSIKNILENLNGLKKNQKIIAKVNWNKRYKYMRMHSALHLMCASIPLKVTGGQIGYEKSRLDFNDPDKEIIIVILANRTYPKDDLTFSKSNIRTRIQELVYEALIN